MSLMRWRVAAALALMVFAAGHARAAEDFFIQTTDPQFGMFANDANFTQETANFEFLIANANRLHPRFVIVCGDLTNKAGDADQIAEYHRIARKLDKDISLYNVAGNHDVGNDPTPESLADYRRNFGPDFYTFQAGEITGIVLNSSLIKAPAKAEREADRQEQWLRQQLAKAKRNGVNRIVIFQHHPYFLERADEDDQYFNIPKTARARYLNLFHEYGVRFIFAGHYHRNALARDGDLEMVTTGPAGMPIGSDPSGFRIVRIAKDSLEHEYVGYGAIPNRIERKITALIVDGINNHDWQTGTSELKKILLATGRFTVDVSTTPPAGAPPEAWSAWHPEFDKYQVVIDNFNGGHTDAGVRWPAAVEQALGDYVRGGGGLVVYHAANNAFLLWDEYNQMIGLGWRDKSFGRGLTVGDDGEIETVPQGTGLNPGHGPRHDFEVRVLDANHPITRGLPRAWMHPSEQLTHGQHGPAQGLTILTFARSEVSGRNEPMDWVRSYGKGRVYTTMLGHTWKDEPNPNLADPEFRKLFAQGVAWAATGK